MGYLGTKLALYELSYAFLFLWWKISKKSIEMGYNILFSETTRLIAKHPLLLFCSYGGTGVKNLLKWDIIKSIATNSRTTLVSIRYI